MIDYVTIRQGIARCVMRAFPDLVVDDEDKFHVNGPSILVRLVDNSHALDDAWTVRRLIDFNVAYLGALDSKKEDVYRNGLYLASSLQPTIAFGDREITVSDVETRFIDRDVQVDFTLDFFDELVERPETNYMQVLEFHLALRKKE